jgi:hypothetical protein
MWVIVRLDTCPIIHGIGHLCNNTLAQAQWLRRGVTDNPQTPRRETVEWIMSISDI